MDALVTKTIDTPYGPRSISVHAQDILTIDRPLDVMTISSFYRGYRPTRGTLLGALYEAGISVHDLAERPAIDLRDVCNIWLSQAVKGARLPIKRIGCIELSSHQEIGAWHGLEARILSSIQAYFHMLHIASLSGVEVGSIGIPVLGAGNQRIDASLVTIPTLNECFRFLRTNEHAKEILIITRGKQQAFQFALALENSYSAMQTAARPITHAAGTRDGARVFISYSSKDKNVADNLCAKLEARGMKAWYAPRDIHSTDYASAIVEAIGWCTHFVVIVSANSLASQHVLNEVDLAFQELNRSVKIAPLKIDEEEMGPAFKYYLSRQHWMDARVPPLERRLEEFVESLCEA